MKSTELKFIILALGIIALMFGQYLSKRHDNSPHSLVGTAAPLFTAQTLDGTKKIALKDLIGKKVILVNLWATWCAPCQDEMPLLVDLEKRLDPSRYVMLSLLENDAATLDEIKAQLAEFEKKIPLPFPVYSDRDGAIASQYGTFKIPESFLIDLKGNIVQHYIGAVTPLAHKDIIERVNKLGAAK